ncbi:MAG TPA: DegQ family serine endoprotease [bacterium]|nr:DegQ family serine endoprotease [bacterium]HNT64467.1 DegQ family serine endoprotease [bacterium]HOX84686.1 DegQ family serine endoprotease [bacterium]HPG45409.1 DegQ family serine endoprotease [bacterium]HPM96815.1 DegQ family serine endoprotease [bacterium]
MISRQKAFWLMMGAFIGVAAWMVISANWDTLYKPVLAEPQAKAAAIQLGSTEPIASELAGLEGLSKAFARVASQVNPAVVPINSEAVVKRQIHPFFEDEFFRRFFNFPEQQQEEIMRGLGSGVIVTSDGHILTNNHVIDEADQIYVTIDKEKYKAKIIGTDPLTDLAVIKIDKNGLSTVRLGDSDQLEVGEWVLAIGNPFSNILQNTVTAGIVSAKGRSGLAIGGSQGRSGVTYQDFIQTDAAINPGNSGGALVNLRGELVGINTAIVGQANVGIGFAIPINMAKSVMKQLMDDGKVSRGYLGVQIQDVDENLAKIYGLDKPRGALVASVQPDSPADKAGIKAEDIIVEIAGEKIADVEQLRRTVASYSPGTEVDVVVLRNEKNKSLKVKLAELDGETAEEPTDKPAKTTIGMRLGLQVQNLTDQLTQRYGYEGESGVFVTAVERNSVADREDIRQGDLIQAVNRQTVKNVAEFTAQLNKADEDDIILLRIKRGSSNLFRALRVPKTE